MVVHMMENCAQKCPTFGRTYVLKINKNIDRGDIEIIINYTCKITFANARFFFFARNHTLHRNYDTFTISKYGKNIFKGCKYFQRVHMKKYICT